MLSMGEDCRQESRFCRWQAEVGQDHAVAVTEAEVEMAASGEALDQHLVRLIVRAPASLLAVIWDGTGK